MVLTLRVTTVEPYLKAWVIAMAAACAGGGIALFLVSNAASHPDEIHFFFDVGVPSRFYSLWILLLQIPIALGMLWWRRRIIKRRRSLQMRAAMAVLIVNVVAIGLLVGSFR